MSPTRLVTETRVGRPSRELTDEELDRLAEMADLLDPPVKAQLELLDGPTDAELAALAGEPEVLFREFDAMMAELDEVTARDHRTARRAARRLGIARLRVLTAQIDQRLTAALATDAIFAPTVT